MSQKKKLLIILGAILAVVVIVIGIILAIALTKDKPCEHSLVVMQGYEATCTDSGLTDGKKCSLCGEILLK